MSKNTCRNIKKSLSAYLDRELSSEQNSLIEKHLQDCPTCQKDLSALKSLQKELNALAQITPLQEPPIDLPEKILLGLPNYDLGIFTDPALRRIAIGITLVLILFTGGLKFFQKPSAIIPSQNLISKIETAPRIIETKSDENQKIALTDGSAIFLKENSLLEIKDVAPDIELILNRGEALFSVIKSSLGRNFIIQTPLIKMQILGTLFKVNIEEKGTEIIVLEGALKLSYLFKEETLGIVKENEKTVITSGQIQPFTTKILSQEEINILKEEFVLAKLVKKEPVSKKPKIIWWREIR